MSNTTLEPIGPLYAGTKMIYASPMTRGDYNNFRGWEIPSDEDPEEDGFMVQYSDGYISWSPEKQFNESYRPVTGLTFGLALEALKKGHKVARTGWNGKNMWLKLVEGRTIEGASDADFKNDNGDLVICSHIDMYSADQKQVVGWLASQTDMLADDWQIIF